MADIERKSSYLAFANAQLQQERKRAGVAPDDPLDPSNFVRDGWRPVDRRGDSTPPVLTGGSGFRSDSEGQSPTDQEKVDLDLDLASKSPEKTLSAAKWDWYQTSVWVDDPQTSGLVDFLLDAWDLSDWCPAPPLNKVYHYGGAIRRGSVELCRLSWGGQPGVNCKTSSSESVRLLQAVRKSGMPHAPTRVDACIDWDEPGLFDRVAAKLRQFAVDNRIRIGFQGDWERNEGRTLYLGGKQSVIQVCLYEKGYEQGGDASKDWVRLEARLGGMKRKDRDRLADWDDPGLVFSVGWLPKACKAIGLEELEKTAIGTTWKQSDDERAFSFLVRQYGPLLKRLANESPAGWDGPFSQLMKALDPDCQIPSSIVRPQPKDDEEVLPAA